jgi:hypothetical protein
MDTQASATNPSGIEKEEFDYAQDVIARLAAYYDTRVVGQQALKFALIASVIADGHVLIESVPGLAKTTAAKAISDAVAGQFSRIQCTPDLLPSDIIGTQIYNQATGKFETTLGPVFANFVLLDEINRSAKCVVQMTLTTWNDDLCRLLEPNVCHTKRRIEVLKEMQKRGIPTVVWLTPILPFINDTEENITSILNECVRVGVKGIIDFGMGLTLRDGDREYYYEALDKHFPGMKERYIKRYGNAYELPSPKARELTEIFQSICKANGILSSPEDCFRFMSELPEKYPQMSLFDL